MPEQPGGIFASISNSYYHLTASEKKVSDYVLANRTGVQFMSISELAEACGVAEATVSRFCRRMKLRGYNDFKLAVTKATLAEGAGASMQPEILAGEILPGDGILELSRKLYAVHTAALSQTMALVDPAAVSRAAELLTGAERVYCMGQGGSMLAAQETAHLFSTVSPKFSSVVDSHMQVSAAALMGPGDALFFCSYSGSTKEMLDVMRLARERGAGVVLMTRFSKSPGAALADIVLQCGSNEGPLQVGSMAAKIAQMYLVDIVFNEFCRRNQALAKGNRERIASALAERHL